MRLSEVLEGRKDSDPRTSYVAKLYSQGVNAILKKVGEESTELILAAKDGDREEVIHEAADLWFHCLVLFAHLDIHPDEVLEELARREGLSGLEEKARRGDGLAGDEEEET